MKTWKVIQCLMFIYLMNDVMPNVIYIYI